MKPNRQKMAAYAAFKKSNTQGNYARFKQNWIELKKADEIRLTLDELMLGEGYLFAEPRRQAMVGQAIFDAKNKALDIAETFEGQFPNPEIPDMPHPRYIRTNEARYAKAAALEWEIPFVPRSRRVRDKEARKFAKHNLPQRKLGRDVVMNQDAELTAYWATMARESGEPRGLIAPEPAPRTAFTPFAAFTGDREMLAAWSKGPEAAAELHQNRMQAKANGERAAKRLLAEMGPIIIEPSYDTVRMVLSRERETAEGAEWAIWQLGLLEKAANRKPRKVKRPVRHKARRQRPMQFWLGEVARRQLDAVVAKVRLATVARRELDRLEAKPRLSRGMEYAAQQLEEVAAPRASRIPAWMRQPVDAAGV